jgi:hypothetical protein
MKIYLQKNKSKKYIKSKSIWKEEKNVFVGTLNTKYWIEYVFILSYELTIIIFLILKFKKIKFLFFGTYFLLTLHVFYINPQYKTNCMWNK